MPWKERYTVSDEASLKDHELHGRLATAWPSTSRWP